MRTAILIVAVFYMVFQRNAVIRLTTEKCLLIVMTNITHNLFSSGFMPGIVAPRKKIEHLVMKGHAFAKHKHFLNTGS